MIALVDCNNFYAACEKVFRPDLKERPLVVLSNNDGCVVARSAEVKALGVKMGVPIFKIKGLVRKHNVKVFSSNYALYADMSQRVMNTLALLSPRVEMYSIDEAFVDLDGIRDKEDFCRSLRKKVLQWTGITVAVGVSRTKTLAKLANRGAKKYPATGGVLILDDERRRKKLMRLTPVEDVWGVGWRLRGRLKAMGIKTALDLCSANPLLIRHQFSVVLQRTVAELRGIPSLTLQEVREPKKQIVTSRSFGRKVETIDDMRQAISEFTEKACAKLREDQQKARYLTVFIQTSPFSKEPYYSNAAHGSTGDYVDNTLRFNRLAQTLLKRIWKKGCKYKKGGVMLADFCPADQIQGSLFPAEYPDALMPVIDKIKKIGDLRLASTGYKHRWAMRRTMLSPAYTTKWADLPMV